MKRPDRVVARDQAKVQRFLPGRGKHIFHDLIAQVAARRP